MLPEFLRPFFWDVNPAEFSAPDYPDYTIARLLEYGDDRAIGWLRATFSEEDIKRVLRAERRLTRRSANYWALLYGIPHEEVAAFTAPDPHGG
jgi:hypothetical protein